MTAINLDSKLPGAGVPDDLAAKMYDALGSHHMAIVELRVTERTEPADGEADRSAKIRTSRIEFAADSEDAERLRQALRDRWQARTAANTLDEEGTWREWTDAATSFHEGLLAHIAERGQLGGYAVACELTAEGGLTIHVSPDKAPEHDDPQGTFDEITGDGSGVALPEADGTVERVGEPVSV